MNNDMALHIISALIIVLGIVSSILGLLYSTDGKGLFIKIFCKNWKERMLK
jgi:hypothetical protein